MTDEELEAIRKMVAEHDTDTMCLTLPACCEVGSGQVTQTLLAEVDRLRKAISEHDKNGAPECYLIDAT